MNTEKWTAFTATAVTAINGDATAPTLKALASAGQKCGNELDNTSDLNLYADFELLWRNASSPTAGAVVSLYLVPSLDGTNYSDGADDSVTPPAHFLVGVFICRAVSTAQRDEVRGVLLGPGKYKPVIANTSGQAFTNTDAENVLRYRMYNLAVA
jgi:hypothetical protein